MIHLPRCVLCRVTLAALAAWLGLPAATDASQPARDSSRPNIVVILADDLGYGDVRCNNPQRGKIPTPNVDRLAREGMRFSDGHSASSVCSPSRYSLLTGRYHWRTRLQSGIVGVWEKPLIAAERLTLAGFLKGRGYHSACIGKWHLGWDWPIGKAEAAAFRAADKGDAKATPMYQAAWRKVFSEPIAGGPTTRGFDEYFGTDVPNWPPYCFIDKDRTVGIPSDFLPGRLLTNRQASKQGPALPDWKLEAILPALADRACDYIRRRARESTPFFLYLPLTAPHTPLAVNASWQGKSGLNVYADFVMETDAMVGKVLEALQQAGVAENTLVVFTSDNGCATLAGVAELERLGHFPSGPLRGYKAGIYEGGHRVPFIVRWPGIVQAGSTCPHLVQQADLLATCADILQVRLPETAAEDSLSFLPLLKGGTEPVRQILVSQSAQGQFAFRKGPWKLIFNSEKGSELYNLADDLAEARNVSAQHPRLVAQLNDAMAEVIRAGRSTPGSPQKNDVAVRWQGLAAGK